MNKLLLHKFLSFAFSTLFFFIPSCKTGVPTSKVDTAQSIVDRLPTRRELRDRLRKQQNILFVYPADEQSANFYQTRVDAIKKNERFGLDAKGIKISQLTKEQLSKNILLIIGNVGNHPLLKELQSQLPVQLTGPSFSFDGQAYTDKDAIFKLFLYPNPYNQSLPLFLVTGNDNSAIQQYLHENYTEDFSRMLRSNWGYEVLQNGASKVSGYLSETDWTLDKKIHFDFTNEHDTILQTSHFQFIAHRSPLSKEQITTIAKKCEATYEAITNFIGTPPNLPKIDYHFYPSVEHKGLQQSSMKEAVTKFDENRIEVVMNDNFQGSQQHPENKLLFRTTLGKPQLDALEEGLANYFTASWQKKGYNYWTQKLFFSKNLPPLKELLDNDFYLKESYLVMGAMAGSFVDFLIEKFGKKAFLANYADWKYNDLIPLEQEWNAYLTSKVIPSLSNAKLKQQKLPYLKGFNFAHEGYRVYNGYGSKLAKESMEKLKDLGSNAIAIVPYSFMRNPKRPDYIPVHQGVGGENDQAVLFSHYEAKKMGLSTMLKPQIWVRGSWPGDIEMQNEKDWATFFENYYRWARHYALLAEINGFDSYCIGVEFAKATLAKEQEWRDIIRKIKGLYNGPLTYAANWGPEFENLKFWDELDFIGLNCYYPLSKGKNPSKRELSKAFLKVIHKIETVHRKYNKPLVFTEIGFRSVDEPWKNPHAEADGRPFNETHQQLCYEVIFENIQNKKWCNGILWWKWPSYISYRGNQNTGFAPSLKQTENVVEKFFKTKID